MSNASQEAEDYVREYAERWHIGGDQLRELYALAAKLGLIMSKDVLDRCAELLERSPWPLPEPPQR